MSAGVSVADVARGYGSGSTRVEALRGVTLTIESGEVVAFVGPSGSGKTTLLNCIAGLDSPDRGSIEVLGTNVATLGYEEAVAWRRRHVAIAFQAGGLLAHLSAAENIDVALRIRGLGRSERRDRVVAVLQRMGLADLGELRSPELSGGQRQRVALARALAVRPALLIADEPTGQLDAATAEVVLGALLEEVHVHGTTVLMATHDAVVEAAVDRSIRLVDGCVADGDVQ